MSSMLQIIEKSLFNDILFKYLPILLIKVGRCLF